MSERLRHHAERPLLDNLQLGELVHSTLAFLTTLWPARFEDDTEIDWEDGEPRGDSGPN